MVVVAAYYNEIDPFAAQWLRNLIAAGLIAPGEVDTRSIEEVQPDDLRGFAQCHFFAGIAGWSAALRMAGWDDDRPIWTGSCPCQPFSAAGKQRGTDDERHLWPVFAQLIRECRPPVVAGEQVASALGRSWLAAVRADLEAMGYAVGAADLCAASVGAPHIRQRLWWVADSASARPLSGAQPGIHRHEEGAGPRHGEPQRRGRADGLADAGRERPHGQHALLRAEATGRHAADLPETAGGGPGVLADSLGAGLEGRDARPLGDERPAVERGGEVGELGDADEKRHHRGGTRSAGRHEPADHGSPWAALTWLPCRDGKARPTQPGLQPLAHGVPARVGRLRAYGNAIVPQVAAEFVSAFIECRP